MSELLRPTGRLGRDCCLGTLDGRDGCVGKPSNGELASGERSPFGKTLGVLSHYNKCSRDTNRWLRCDGVCDVSKKYHNAAGASRLPLAVTPTARY